VVQFRGNGDKPKRRKLRPAVDSVIYRFAARTERANFLRCRRAEVVAAACSESSRRLASISRNRLLYDTDGDA